MCIKNFYIIFFINFVTLLSMENNNNSYNSNTHKNTETNLVEVLQHNNPANENKILEKMAELYNEDFGPRRSQEQVNHNYVMVGSNANLKAQSNQDNNNNNPNDIYDRAKARELKAKQKKFLELKITELNEILNKDETLRVLFLHIFRHIMTNINELRTEVLSRKILNYGPEYDPEKGNPKLELMESPENLRNTLTRIEDKINSLEIKNKKDARVLKCMVATYSILTILVIAILIATNDVVNKLLLD